VKVTLPRLSPFVWGGLWTKSQGNVVAALKKVVYQQPTKGKSNFEGGY